MYIFIQGWLVSVYRYSQNSAIDEVTFQQSSAGSVRAYLHARPGIDDGTINAITKYLGSKNWHAIPYTLDGKPVLEVRGFKRESQLLEHLGKHKWLDGKASVEQEKINHVGFVDKVKKRSLQTSGLFYVIGDYNFFTYGRKEGHWEDMLAGIMYAGGTAALVGYGRNDQSDIQVKDLSKRIARHLMKEGMKLPSDCALPYTVEDENRSIIGKVHDTFKRNPSEMFNLFTGLAGACITASAIRYKLLNKLPLNMADKDITLLRTAGWLDVGLGTMTMASTAIGGLVEEHKRDPDKPKSHGVQAVLDFVRERPLTIAGAGLMVSTGLHAISSWLEYNHARETGNAQTAGAIKNRLFFVLTNLTAEFLIAASSKGHGKGVVSDLSVDNSVIALTADLIIKQPAKYQEQMIDYMSKFLGREDVLAMKDDEVKNLLQAQVELMKKNPWVKCREILPSTAPIQEPAQEKPLLIPDRLKANWQVTINSPQQNSPTASFI